MWLCRRGSGAARRLSAIVRGVAGCPSVLLAAAAPIGGGAATARGRHRPGRRRRLDHHHVHDHDDASRSRPRCRSSITGRAVGPDAAGQGLALDAVGVDTSALQAAIAATQQQLDQDAVAARQLPPGRRPGRASGRPPCRPRPSGPSTFHSLDSAVKQAVLFLYMHGPSALTVNPAAGNTLAYAVDYADTAITPNGLLATRSFDARQGTAGAGRSEQGGRTAKRAMPARTQPPQPRRQRSDGWSRSSRAISAESAATANQVAADHAALAAQAGDELLSATSPSVHPKAPIPPPLATTARRAAVGLRRARQTLRVGCDRPQLLRLLGLDPVRLAAGGV